MILLRPEWVLALIPLVFAGGWLWTRHGGLGAWEKASDPDLLRAMTALGQADPAQARGPFWLAMTALVLLTVALAGPAVERRDTPSFRNLDGVLFVIDASASVTEHEAWPQMLTMGRFGLSSLGSRPGGIIVFAGDAYAATEMTHDHLQLGQTFSLISADTVPDKGSRPELGLEMAADLLRTAEVVAGDVVLFTDGAGLGPASRGMAEAIAAQGARLSIVTLGDPAEAETYASAGQGRVFTPSETEALGTWLGEDARRRLEQQDFPLLFWSDLGRYMVLLAMVPLLLLFRREA
ncbi:MAG: vWA domain-containing protein [Pseudomonadota bacterium]